VLILRESFGFLKYTGGGSVIFQRGGCSGVGSAQGAAFARKRRAQVLAGSCVSNNGCARVVVAQA
jgi:hypothetical protein